ncbi:MAG: hypothetical protein MJZ99_11210 [Bacteroidales bacterium]|nr:hypothetical protein [Bacteroidales bacterium]
MIICIAMESCAVWAQSASVWDGVTPATTWNAAGIAAAGITGSGTEADAYVIHNATGFVYFWWAANNGNLDSSTQYWKLDADIDLNNTSWPYANLNKTFKGKFDGQNHTISNMKLVPHTSNYNYGLFCMVEGQAADNRAEVKNLTIDNATIAPDAAFGKTTSVGIVIGKSTKYADITNVNVTNSQIVYSNNINDANYVGGIAGQTASDTRITNCTVSSLTITTSGTTTKAYFGGMIGYIGSQTDVANCSTTGVTITYTTIANESRLSGFIGYAKGAATVPVTITGCTVTNTNINLTAGINNASYIGAFVAQTANNVQITANNAVVSPTISVGGDIVAASYIGGAIGDLAGAADNPVTTVSGLTVTSPSVTINKNSVANNCFGATFGRINTYSAATSISVSNPSLTYNATDDPDFTLNVGSFAGYVAGNATQEVTATSITITGNAKVVLGTGTSNLSNIRAGLVGYANANVRMENWTIENTEVQVKGNLTTKTSYLGGVVGYTTTGTNTPITLKDITVTDSSKIIVGGSVDCACYVGGAVGYLTVTNATYSPITATKINVSGLDISFDGNFTNSLYVGGIAGQLKAQATPNTIKQCSVSGKIRSVGSHTFVQDKSYAFGGILGYTDQSATAVSEVRQCTSKVDFDLSGFTPATTSDGNYNLYRNAFIVGGIVGRLSNPSRLPEHVYYSGKIYAPFAAVAPIVGMFYTANNSHYPYNEYSGVSSTNVTAEEWKKTNSWYYADYKIGLSDEVLNQTERTPNYSNAPIIEDGVSYLAVDDETFKISNNILNIVKQSKTVLAYNVSGANVDGGIFPAWNTNSTIYPAYYMYYMQGVNRGLCKRATEEDFLEVLMRKEITFVPTITRTGDIASGYVFTVNPGEISSDTSITISYQWYKSDKTTPLTGETSNTLSLTDGQMDDAGGVVCCKITVSGEGFSPVSSYLLGYGAVVVFIDGTNGIDNTAGSRDRGWTPSTPVKTIDHANSLLSSTAEGGSWEKNIIVVMGMLNANIAFQSTGSNPATLTGKWDGIDYGGIIEINKIAGEDEVNKVNQIGQKGHHCYVKADTKFEYLTFKCKSNTNDNNFIECHGNDVWFGKGLVMTDFRNLSKGHGNLDAVQSIPELTIVLTATNLSEADIRTYTNRTKPQVLTIESGHYGRIMGGRFTNSFFGKATNTSHTILGSAEHPVWAVINIDIDKDNPNTGTVNRAEEPNKGIVTNNFTCDINCVIAGLTDGSVYGDYEINVHGGTIGYIVGGNQGNPVPNGSKTFTQPGGKSGNWGQWPNASYFGRTIINVEHDPSLKDVTICNLYAGGLGRDANGASATSIVDMYMYGHTEINLKSGTILNNIYGGGAGGVTGLGPWDMHAPYATTAADDATNAVMNKVQYGTWGSMPAGSPLANVTLHNPDGNGGYTTSLLNLNQSYITLNISGGTVNGSVYGGGCGYVSNMPQVVAMQGVGSIFGTSNVNISGGTILGSIYGGSEGNEKYYGTSNKYGQVISHIAETNGTINMRITGTDAQYPTIGGNIYGGGKGIPSTYSDEYLRIATSGNSDLDEQYKTDINILIDLPESHPFNGNIYGGGQMGFVDGNTKIVVKGGVINGDIFGAGKGEDGHPNKAKVTGNTSVIIDRNWTE